MGARKQAKVESLLNTLLDEASWLLSHAQALTDYGREKEAAVEWLRAANSEEQIAYLLDVVAREAEAVVHRVSAASCYEQIGEFARAATLLRAVLSASLPEEYRQRIQRQLAMCLAQATKPKSPSSTPRKLASGF
jgi:thioredoxin-like negative regulator of GroEL